MCTSGFIPEWMFTTDRLNQTNYVTWRSEMKCVLVRADLWETVEGEVAERIAGSATHVPPGSTATVQQTATAQDKRKDLKAVCTLHVNVSELVRDQVWFDTNGFETINGWTRKSMSFVFVGLENIPYYVYEFNNLTTVENFTNKFYLT